MCIIWHVLYFCKQKTAYEMRISDWSSDVCSSDLVRAEEDGHDVLAGEDGLVTDAAADIALLDGCRERRADVGGVDAAVLEGGGHVRVGQRRLLHVGDRQAALLQDQVAVVGRGAAVVAGEGDAQALEVGDVLHGAVVEQLGADEEPGGDRKSTRLNSSH